MTMLTIPVKCPHCDGDFQKVFTDNFKERPECRPKISSPPVEQQLAIADARKEVRMSYQDFLDRFRNSDGKLGFPSNLFYALLAVPKANRSLYRYGKRLQEIMDCGRLTVDEEQCFLDVFRAQEATE
jgi:hypothetical protein